MRLTRRERKVIKRAVAADLGLVIAEEGKRLADLELEFARTRLILAELEIENATFERFMRETA